MATHNIIFFIPILLYKGNNFPTSGIIPQIRADGNIFLDFPVRRSYHWRTFSNERMGAERVPFFIGVKMALAEKIAEILSPAAQSAGTKIARVEFARQTLRIFLERADGSTPTVDELAALSRAFSARLDVEDPIRDRYFLEVSSTGSKLTEEEFREILKKTKGTKND
jgi:hypothetical protein